MTEYLREYQRQAIDAFRKRIAEGQENRLAVELATGLGKTVTGAALAASVPSALILTHTEEITQQWEAKLRFAVQAAGSSATVGVVKAGRDEPQSDIVVASVQTVRKPARFAEIGQRDLIIADECHHSVASSWREVLHAAGAWDGVPTLGLTATLARTDGQGLGQVWQDMIFSRGITWAQRKGYLLDIIPWRVRVPDISASTSDIALDAMLADSIAPELVVQTWMSKAVGLCEECRAAVEELPAGSGPALPSYCPNGVCGVNKPLPSTVLFAPLVKSAQAFADAFSSAGVRASVIHGGSKDRDEILARYERGEIAVLCNAMVLTEGWDSPRTRCVIWGRPTGSRTLFIQGIGRGLRPELGPDAPPRDQQRCTLIMVTDPSGAGLVTVADLSDRPLGEMQDGRSVLEMEDEYDLGRELDEVERAYRGPVRVEEWDLAVQHSAKAWKTTKGGVPFLPTAKRQQGYVFIVGSTVYFYGPHPKQRGRMGARKVSEAPDLSLALSLAEFEAQERGGDIGALLADKGRPWRKQVPSMDAIRVAVSAGVSQSEIDRILHSKASGKAGKLSDLTDTMMASRVLDPLAQKIRGKE